jgi:hypothetical protein
MGHVVYFDFGFIVVKVIASDSDMIRSLQEFFDPYIPIAAETSDCDEIVVEVDPQVYDATKSTLPARPDTEIPTILQHDVEYQLKCFNSNDVTLIEDEPLKVFYQILERRTRIIATEGSRVRTALLRIVRGAWVLGQSGMIVHGCVLEKNGNGIVVSGEKYAGKSTSLLSLCLNHGYDIVANDRLLLTKDGIARGIPTVVKLRTGTLRPFPEWRHLVDLPMFGVSDLARELKVSVRKEAAIKTLVLLRYDESVREPVFSKLSLAEAYELLQPNIFSRSEYEWTNLMKLGNTFDRENEADIPNTISCFRLNSNERVAGEAATLMDTWCQA